MSRNPSTRNSAHSRVASSVSRVARDDSNPTLDRWPAQPFGSRLANWRAARDNAANEPVDIMYYGNSLTMGGTAVAQGYQKGGWLKTVGDVLNAPLGLHHGLGWLHCTTSGGAKNWTLTNTSGNSLTDQRIGFSLWTTILQAGDKLTLDSSNVGAFDNLDIVYAGIVANGGKIQITLDGSVVDTIDINDPSIGVALADTGRTWNSGPLSLSTHTLVIEALDAAVYIEGAYLYNSNYNAGFRMWNGAHAGYWGNHFQSNPSNYGLMYKKQPALAVWANFYNDRHLPMSVYVNATQDFINKVKANCPNTDILLCSEWRVPNWGTTDPPANDLPWQDMLDTMKQLAEDNNVAYLDLGSFMGSCGYDGVFNDPFRWCRRDDGTHQTAAGFQRWADIHSAFLLDNKPPARPQGFVDKTLPESAAWQVSAKNYDASNTQLVDQSGNNNHAVLGAGAVYLDHAGGKNYVYLPGAVADRVVGTYNASFNVSGNIEIITYIAPDSWTPSSNLAIVTRFAPTAANRVWQVVLLANGRLRLQVYTDGSGTSQTANSSAATGFTDGTGHWIRVRLDKATGDVNFATSDDAFTADSTASISWSTLSDVSLGSAITPNPGNSDIYIGNSISTFFIGKNYRAILNDGFNGTTVADFNPSKNGTHTSWSDDVGVTWTVSRSSSGKKATFVDEPKILLGGTSSWLEVADNGLLNFDGDDEFTLVCAFRRWGTTATITLLSKDVTATTDGYALWAGNIFGFISIFTITEGDTDSIGPSSFVSSGGRHVITGVRSTSVGNYAFIDTTKGVPTTTGNAFDLTNSVALRVGAYSDSASGTDFEFMGAAIFRRALTDEEVEQLADLL